MSDDDHKPNPETHAERPAAKKKAPARKRAAAAKPKSPAKPRQSRKSPAADDAKADAPASASGAPAASPGKLDLFWAITGVVFYAGIGFVLLFVMALLAVFALLLRMASGEPAEGIDAPIRDLQKYGGQVLDFIAAPLGPMPFPFAPWPGKGRQD